MINISNIKENKIKNLNKTFWITLGILVALILIYLFIPQVNSIINQMISYLVALDMEGLKGYILSFGVCAPIISFLLMILQSIAAPLPAFVITFANAALFGWVKGAILSWSSAMVGAALCFYIAKFLGRNTVENLTSKFALDSVDDFFEKYGRHTILIARLLPFMSFDLVSYAAGLTSMSFASFFIATGVGQLPATVVYSYVGGMLTGGAKLMMTGLLTLFAFSILIYVIKMVCNEKNNKK